MHKFRRDKIGTGSFVHMEENITTINYNKEATEQNYYKATGGRYHTHKKCVENKDEDEGEGNGKQECGNVPL